MADVVTRFKLETTQFDSKLRDASKSLSDISREAVKAGKGFSGFTKDNIEAARSLGQIKTSSTNAKDKLKELVAAFNDAAKAYNGLSKEMKQNDYGKAMAQSLDQLKARIRDTKNELAGAKSGMSGFSSVLGELGSKLGLNSQLTGALTTGTVGLTAAVGAGAAAAGAAAIAWADYNTELAKSQQDVSVITGLKGQDADEMTAGIRALVRTYDVDFRDAVNAANALMQQFGVTGDAAFDLLRSGLQGMLQGDGPKLLSMIQQYAPAFHDAGIEASQLVAVIQNSEGGLFTDDNMNAIVMGIKNIRLMTDKTSEALAKLGIDGADMSRKLNEGTMTVFDALKQVSSALEGVESGSQTAGEVMQQVFGRQGTAAGTKLGEAIASLNLNLEDTKLQTGDVGDSLDDLVDANIRLEKAMADCFGFDGWTQMSNSIRATLLSALADVITAVSNVKEEIWAAYKLALSLIPGGSVVNGIMGLSGSGGGGSSSDGGAGSAGGGGGGVRGGNETPTAATIPIKLGGGGGGGKRTRRSGGGGGRTGGRSTHKETPAERAKKMVDQALANYEKAINEATMRFEYGIDNSEVMKKKELAAQERLTMAYADAYNIYNNEKYKTAFEDAAAKYRELADVVKGKRDEFEQAMSEMIERIKSANPLEDAANKLADESMEDHAKRKGISLDTGNGANEKKVPGQWKWGDRMGNFLGDMSSGMNQIVGGLEDLGIKVPDGIKKVITIMTAVSAILGGINAVLITIAMTKILPLFNNGGIVPHAADGYVVGGTHYSNDVTPIMANAGEVVLSRAQVGNLSSQLQGMGSMQLEAVIEGEDIRLALQNGDRRRGRGEYVTSKSR